MRGKLRDKRVTTRRDSAKRELAERRKPAKRDAKNSFWLNQGAEDDELDLLDAEADDDETEEAATSKK